MSKALATHGLGAALALGGFACALDDRDHAGHCPTRELPGDFDGEDLELLRGYTHVGGGLVVPGDTRDLSALGCLEEVNGALEIDDVPKLADLDGLEALRRVGGLVLEDLPRLQSTEGLAGLESIGEGGMSFRDLVALEEIAAPANLREFEGRLEVFGSPALKRWPTPLAPAIEDIVVYSLPPTAEVGAFANLETAHTIYIGPADAPAKPSVSNVSFAALVSVDGLALDGVGPATIASLTSLHDVGTLHLDQIMGTDLTGLESLVAAESLWMAGGDALVSLRGLDGLATLSELRIMGMPLLRDLDGLAAVRDMPVLPLDRLGNGPVIPALTIEGCPALVDVGGLSGVQSDALSSLTLAAVPMLTAAPSWPSLRRLGGLTLEMTGITDLDAFAGITTLSSIRFDSETMMPFASADFSISLADNPALVDLGGLAGVTTVDAWGDIAVQDNPALPTCAVDEMVGTLDALGRTGGQLEVSGNDDDAGC